MTPSNLILFVEDDESDRLLFAKAFRASGLQATAKFVDNGYDMKDYLLREDRYANRLHPVPSVIVTDFQMPGMDGLAVLRWIKTSQQFQHIPVVLLSAVMMHDEFVRARELGADMYLCKPDGLHDTIELFRVSFPQFFAPQTRLALPVY